MNKKWISVCAAAALLLSTAACSTPAAEESARPLPAAGPSSET